MSLSQIFLVICFIFINHGSTYDGVTYNCEDRNPCTVENAQNGSYYFPHDDRTKFVQCSHWQQCFIMQCPNGTIWNPEVIACDHDNRPPPTPEVETLAPEEVKIEEVTDAETPDQEPQVYDCEEKNPCTKENAAEELFYFPHKDVTKFVQCGGYGQCFIMLCPPGTVWNPQITTCDHDNRPPTEAPEDQTTLSPFRRMYGKRSRFPKLSSF